jgi:hypothetical protein
MPHPRTLCVVLAVLLLLPACAYRRDWYYHPNLEWPERWPEELADAAYRATFEPDEIPTEVLRIRPVGVRIGPNRGVYDVMLLGPRESIEAIWSFVPRDAGRWVDSQFPGAGPATFVQVMTRPLPPSNVRVTYVPDVPRYVYESEDGSCAAAVRAMRFGVRPSTIPDLPSRVFVSLARLDLELRSLNERPWFEPVDARVEASYVPVPVTFDGEARMMHETPERARPQ